MILVRPDGKYLYVTNRSDELQTTEKPAMFKHGENDIAVYVLDAKRASRSSCNISPRKG